MIIYGFDHVFRIWLTEYYLDDDTRGDVHREGAPSSYFST